jgi:hypothetical protein
LCYWTNEAGTGQQVAKLLDWAAMMMMTTMAIMMMLFNFLKKSWIS